ncbi:hypothetical protein [Arthrobacter sp. ES1]|uniref:hypothetical protein n=1 Tax=Arthrobacter sp. ES1 TaxID=1897056 RepID=UPI001CFF94BE|nr:hypothetical protein [Arthrobacter sp. ES1]MCB5280343.1 hypothetical protein [Arthrobacter sp. ES1]
MSVTVRRKARKAHRCDSCGRAGAIQPGDAYLVHTALAGDEFGYHEYGDGNRPRRSNECAECATRYGRGQLLAGPVKPIAEGSQPSRVLDIAAAIMLAAERDGIEMFVAKMHFLCYQVQGWTLARTGRPAFAETIYADADGVRIDAIRDAYAPLGDGIFTLQDAIDAGIITMPRTSPEPTPAG